MATFRIAFIGTQDEKRIAEIAREKFGWDGKKDGSIELVDISEMSQIDILSSGAFQGVLYYGSIHDNETYEQKLDELVSNQEDRKDLSIFALTHEPAGVETAKKEQEALMGIYSKYFPDITPDQIQVDPANAITDHEVEAVFNGVVKPIAQIYNDRAEESQKTAEEILDKMVELVISATEEKHDYTAGHVDRVSRYTEALAREMGMTEKQVKEVSLAARLHDIGKIVVRDAVLAKPADLSYSERQEMGEHAEQGVAILKAVIARAPELAEYITPEVIKGVGYHHKDWNGLHGRKDGEPDKIRGEKVGDYALTLSVADCIDAMTSQRAYNNPKHILEMFRDLYRNRNEQFREDIADAAILVFAKEAASLGIDPLKIVEDEPKGRNAEVDTGIKAFLEAHASEFEVNREAVPGAYGKLGFRLDATGHLEFEGEHAPVRDLNIPYQDKVKFRIGQEERNLKNNPKAERTTLTNEEKARIENSSYNMIMGDEAEGKAIMERAAVIQIPQEMTVVPITERILFEEEQHKSLASQIVEASKTDQEYNLENAQKTNGTVTKEIREQMQGTKEQEGAEK